MTELEKAAREYCKNVKQSTGRGSDPVNAFQAGVQWKSEQSPWISVEKRLPERDGLRVWVKSTCLNNQPLVYHDGRFYARLSDGAYDGSVIHWMPIPE